MKDEWLMGWIERMRCRIVNAARLRHPDSHPRRWSNKEIQRLAPLCAGDVVNVSGWKDLDKQGRRYRDYFTAARKYDVTNYWGSAGANDGLEGSLFLDLQGPLVPELEQAFDTAFCHTVLEHLPDVGLAMRHLAHMSRDAVLLVVPFAQDEHYTPGIFGDYWRFTPMGLKWMFEQAGLSVVHLSANDQPWYPVYLVALGVRDPSAWAPRLSAVPERRERLYARTFNYERCIW
jgi:hypothetical protein